MITRNRRKLRFSKQCSVRRVESANGNVVVVAADVGCSSLYPASAEEAERENMITAARALTLFTEPLSGNVAIERDWRIVMDEKEYRIRGVSPWPWDDPVYWQLLVEDES